LNKGKGLLAMPVVLALVWSTVITLAVVAIILIIKKVKKIRAQKAEEIEEVTNGVKASPKPKPSVKKPRWKGGKKGI